MELILAFLAGAYGRRAIGAGVFESLRLSRILFWCVPMQVMFLLYNPNHIALSIVVAIAALIGISPGYFGGEFNLAEKRNRTLSNYLVLAIRGGFIALPIAIVLLIARGFGFYDGYCGFVGIAAGWLLPMFYLLGLKLEGRLRLPLVDTFPNWGEWFLGGAVMAGIGASL